MGLSPKSPTSIQESTSGSSELQPFHNLDDSSSLQVQDEISALEQQELLQRQLYECELEQIRLQTEIHGHQEFLDGFDMRLQRLDEDMRMEATRLLACLKEMEEEERDSETIEGAAGTLSGNVMRSWRAVRNLETEMRELSAQLESLQTQERSIGIKLERADQDAKALSEAIENIQMQQIEESDCLPPIEKRNTSPASESKPSTSDSAKEM